MQISSSEPAALDPRFLEDLIDDTLAALPPVRGDGAARRRLVAAAIRALRPADPFQAILAAEAVAAHYAVMAALGQAAEPGLDPKMAARLRANANATARMMQATVRALKASQSPAPTPPSPGRAPVAPEPPPPPARAVAVAPALVAIGSPPGLGRRAALASGSSLASRAAPPLGVIARGRAGVTG